MAVKQTAGRDALGEFAPKFAKRRILGKLLRLGGESIGSVIEHFMTAEAVEQAKAPMPELERLYREAVPEAVEYLGELYTLREGAYHLSKRWDRTYNG